MVVTGATGDPIRCASCNRDNPADALFCEKCGAKLELICPACKASVSPGARFCRKCGIALAATRPDSRPTRSSESPIRVTADAGSTSEAVDGERKTVTALFADIKGSMELMEDLDPEEARGIVDPALKLMFDAVHRYDGYIVQSTGTVSSRSLVRRWRMRTIRRELCMLHSGRRKRYWLIRGGGRKVSPRCYEFFRLLRAP